MTQRARRGGTPDPLRAALAEVDRLQAEVVRLQARVDELEAGEAARVLPTRRRGLASLIDSGPPQAASR